MMKPLLAALSLLSTAALPAQTVVSIQGGDFHINGKPSYEGRKWKGHRIEGLLMNSRMVQGVFDDLNPETAGMWAYPDTGKWDAERNTREFIAAMAAWREHGMLAFTLNLQGGSPQGYSKGQPWHNSAIYEDGTLRPEYMARTERIIRTADELGMVVILGIFYFGQDQRIKDERAIIKAVDSVTDWVLEKGWRNTLIEINNEANYHYDHDILKPGRVHELIQRVQAKTKDRGRLLVSTSFGGGSVPSKGVIKHSDFLLIHGNGVKGPDAMRKFIARVKQAAGDKVCPIIINEDDHFDFDKEENNFTAAVSEGVSWGYFDYRKQDEPFEVGYQSVPVDWGMNTERKRAYFRLIAEITGVKE